MYPKYSSASSPASKQSHGFTTKPDCFTAKERRFAMTSPSKKWKKWPPKIVESYPLRTEITKLLPYERYMGILSTYERIGFQVVASRSERRPVMRYVIGTEPSGMTDQLSR